MYYGLVTMIDISAKKTQVRKASAAGVIRLREETVKSIIANDVKKGDVLETAKIAGMMAAKSTPDFIPYCHPVPVESVKVNFKIEKESIRATCDVSASYKTGVEMEALSCVSIALLTIWDMVKYIEKDETGNYPVTFMENIRVLSKVKEDA